MNKKVYDIQTTGDLKMSVQKSKTTLRDANGTHPQEDEIAFVIHGYSVQKEKEVEEVVTISKEEAKHLVNILNQLAK